MAHRLAAGIHSDPVWVRIVDLLPAGVGVGSRDHVHAHRAAAGQQVAEAIAIAEPCAALLQRNLRGIERHHAACAQAGRIGMNAAEIIEPELSIVVAGIVFDERKLRPAHGPVVPADCAVLGLRRFGDGCRHEQSFVRDRRQKTTCCRKC